MKIIIKKTAQSICRTIILAALGGVLFLPLMMQDASAATKCTTNSDCDGQNGTYVGWSCATSGPNAGYCVGDGDCSRPYDSGNVCNPPKTERCYPTESYYCTPEMSDYLAAAFVVVAGGMLFYFRRRSVAKV